MVPGRSRAVFCDDEKTECAALGDFPVLAELLVWWTAIARRSETAWNSRQAGKRHPHGPTSFRNVSQPGYKRRQAPSTHICEARDKRRTERPCMRCTSMKKMRQKEKHVRCSPLAAVEIAEAERARARHGPRCRHILASTQLMACVCETAQPRRNARPSCECVSLVDNKRAKLSHRT